MAYRPIAKLSAEVIGHIAAGEVVENPASAIKELIENSLDAGATCVTVEIRDGGISYFRVTDNGSGIRASDIRMAFERSATSKIVKTEDLFDLHSLGFRGEALASIAAVGKVVLTTHNAADETGMRAVNEGGKFGEIRESAAPIGTTVVVRNLFFNTPVRLKFLKKPVTEAALVSETVARMILARPDVAFRFISNGKQIYSSSGNGELRSAVFCLYGRETASAMIPVHSEGAVSVEGLVGVGLQARASRSRQTFIVNGRTIRSQLLSRALEEGCRERVTIGHYPICVLKIEVPSALVDVNVHPNKLEVRFSNEQLILQNISGAVRDAFSLSPLESAPQMRLTDDPAPQTAAAAVRVVSTETPEGLNSAKQENTVRPRAVVSVIPQGGEKPLVRPSEKVSPEQHAAFASGVAAYFGGMSLHESVPAPGQREPLAFAQPMTEKKPEPPKAAPAPAPKPKAVTPVFSGEEKTGAVVPVPEQKETNNAEEPVQAAMELPAESAAPSALAGYSMVGVAFDTYIILQNDKQLILVDQHAAHERILYEKLMRSVDTQSVSQPLLVPQVIEVTPRDAEKIETYAQEIREAGYELEAFGDHAYQLRAVPNVMGEPQGREMFLYMLDHLGELQVLSTRQKRRDAILQMACKKAIKGGEKLTMAEIEPLLADMFRTNAPPTCPHGRPLVVVLTRSELEKRFRRIND